MREKKGKMREKNTFDTYYDRIKRIFPRTLFYKFRQISTYTQNISEATVNASDHPMQLTAQCLLNASQPQ
jgi:hypothetical protein